MTRCRWVADASVPGGRFHVPGCWGTVHDPDGPCHCPNEVITTEERLDDLERIVRALVERLDKKEPDHA